MILLKVDFRRIKSDGGEHTEDIHFTVRQSRAALARSIQVLRHTDEERLTIMMSAANGFHMKNSDARVHAAVYGKMFEILLNDFDERYRTEQYRIRQEKDSK